MSAIDHTNLLGIQQDHWCLGKKHVRSETLAARDDGSFVAAFGPHDLVFPVKEADRSMSCFEELHGRNDQLTCFSKRPIRTWRIQSLEGPESIKLVNGRQSWEIGEGYFARRWLRRTGDVELAL